MGDWKDDLAKVVLEQIARHNQETEAYNTRQQLIKVGAPALWNKAKEAISAALAVINQQADKKVLSVDSLDESGRSAVFLSYAVEATPVTGSLNWSSAEQKVEMTVYGKTKTPKDFDIAIEEGRVVLKSSTSTVDGEGLAREFLETLIGRDPDLR